MWHPYAPMPALVPPLPIVAAEGVRLRLADGRELVDGMSSWWAAVHGYRPSRARCGGPRPARRHEPRDVRRPHPRAGGRPGPARSWRSPRPGLEHVFFADSGSVSVEVAIKMCLQYQRSRGRPGKHRLMTWRGGYHGDTFGAMSVCDPDGGMHALWRDVLPRQVFAARPRRRSSAAYVEELGPAGRGARRRAGRGDRRAGRAGRRRHAFPRPALPARAAGAHARPTTCCWCSTRSPPASGAPASCSRPTTPASPRTSCASARR